MAEYSSDGGWEAWWLERAYQQALLGAGQEHVDEVEDGFHVLAGYCRQRVFHAGGARIDAVRVGVDAGDGKYIGERFRFEHGDSQMRGGDWLNDDFRIPGYAVEDFVDKAQGGLGALFGFRASEQGWARMDTSNTEELARQLGADYGAAFLLPEHNEILAKLYRDSL